MPRYIRQIKIQQEWRSRLAAFRHIGVIEPVRPLPHREERPVAMVGHAVACPGTLACPPRTFQRPYPRERYTNRATNSAVNPYTNQFTSRNFPRSTLSSVKAVKPNARPLAML